jgi:hypothetical protein
VNSIHSPSRRIQCSGARQPFARATSKPFREPQLGALVAAVLDEREEFGVGRRPRSELEAVEVHAMPRRLVVEREERPGVSDLDEAGLVAVPAQRRSGALRALGRLDVGGIQRTARKEVLQVGEDQLLMLLLVVEAEFEQERVLFGQRVSLEERVDAGVDVRAERADFLEARTGEQSARGPRPRGPDRDVVGVEQRAERGIERAVTRQRAGQEERLEEPARVREVPLDRARARHRLDLAVFRAEGFRELERRPPRPLVARRGDRIRYSLRGRCLHPAVHQHPAYGSAGSSATRTVPYPISRVEQLKNRRERQFFPSRSDKVRADR